MTAINDAWHNRRDDIDNNIAALVESLGRTAQIAPDATLPTIDLFHLAASALGKSFDQQWGGFGGAPKFQAR